MNIRSLRFRLAVWYFGTVAVICALAGTGYWFAIRSELNHALDQGLRYRLIGLREFLRGRRARRRRGDRLQTGRDLATRRPAPGLRCRRPVDRTVGRAGPARRARAAAAGTRIRDSVRQRGHAGLSAPVRLAEGDDWRAHADPRRRRSAAQVRGRAWVVHDRPPAVDAGHPRCGDRMRPVARPARAVARGPDHRGRARHHGEQPLGPAGGAGYTGRVAAAFGDAQRHARADRAVVHAHQSVHGRRVSRAAGADDA